MRIFATAPLDYVDCGAGVVIGHLFSRGPEFRRVRSLPEAARARVSSSQGRLLLDEYWGGYVASLVDPVSGAIRIFRDPFGGLPCYYVRAGGGLFLASDVDTLCAAAVLAPRINWANLTHHLHCQDLRSTDTCLEGLSEVMAGGGLTISGDTFSAIQVWSPWDYVAHNGETGQGFNDALRQTIRGCTRAWADAFDYILAPVSGGLDSSVLATCLKDFRTPWECLNMATNEPEGDERSFARILASHVGKALIEANHDLCDVDITRPSSAHLPRPSGFAFGQGEDRIKADLAGAHENHAFFTGQGGDNVFCYMQSATAFLDRVFSEGFGKGAWRTLDDICALTGCSYLDVLAMAAGRWMSGGPTYVWKGDTTLLNPQTLASARRPLDHPWLHAPARSLPGKAVHIAMLVRIQATLESWSRADWGPLITPLLSQPVVELCLKVPTWEWCEGGVNRALVRQAFSGDLPLALIQRRTKGGPNSFCLDVLSSQHNVLKPFLLDGLLAAQGIVDVPALERLLCEGAPIVPPHHLRLSALAEAEAWARHWNSKVGPCCD